jgi:hypothetical protein
MSVDGSDWSRIMGWVPVRDARILSAILDGEAVLLDLRTGRAYRLNPVETVIWKQCTGDVTLDVIHRKVTEQLGSATGHLYEEVISAIVQWSHDGLLFQREPVRCNSPGVEAMASQH